MTAAAARERLGPISLFAVLLLLLAIGPIRSYDYFWHLATGRWIVEHRAVPQTDPFSVASEKIDWINGAWLADVLAYGVQTQIGHDGLSFLRALFVALLFAGIGWRLSRRLPPSIAIGVTLICFIGASSRLGARPETLGIACAVAALALLLREPTNTNIVLLALLTALWANLHQSALLAPAMASIVLVGMLRSDSTSQIKQRSGVRLAASIIPLLLSPYGVETLLAPLRLSQQVGSGSYVNLEWLPSNPLTFPLLYAAITISALVAWSGRRDLARVLLLIVFAALAVRYVRNHGFFFALLPLLLEDDLAELAAGWKRSSAERGVVAVALIIAAVSLPILRPLALGIDPRVFPLHSVGKLKATPVAGTVYNADQFGGLLIWTLYPERRALTDGRNELYTKFLRDLDLAKRDGRAWYALMKRYQPSAALEEYRREPLEIIDAVTGNSRLGTPSLAYFPRKDWALIAFDDVAMLFVRRNHVSASFLNHAEYRELRPDLATREDIGDERLLQKELRRAILEENAPARLSNLASALQPRP